MHIIELLLLAIGLSMDACAVSMTNGMCHQHLSRKHTFAIGICFGGMQGLMPLLGYLLGSAFADIISAFDHYLALILLGFIGAKMIYEALHEEESATKEPFTMRLLFLQGVATSIDALAVGVSFAALQGVSVWIACLLIASVTYALSIFGVQLGKRFGTLLSQKAQIFGGVILIGIGLKIFIEHMWFS